jgi:hypothetical protein
LGKATLDLWEKAGFRPLFQEHFLKPTGFWEMLDIQKKMFSAWLICGIAALIFVVTIPRHFVKTKNQRGPCLFGTMAGYTGCQRELALKIRPYAVKASRLAEKDFFTELLSKLHL